MISTGHSVQLLVHQNACAVCKQTNRNSWHIHNLPIIHVCPINDSSKNVNSTSNCMVSRLTGTPIWSLHGVWLTCYLLTFVFNQDFINTFGNINWPSVIHHLHVHTTYASWSEICLQFYQCIISSRKLIQQSHPFWNRVCTCFIVV